MKQVLRLVEFVLLGFIVVAACSSGTTELMVAPDPEQVVEGYVAAYNAQDIDRVMAFVADDAVIIQGSDRLEGTDVIRTEILGEFEIHAPGGDAYSITNLVVAGDTATWDHEFKGVAHTCTGTGNVAFIDEGLIVTWTLASIDCD
jgi:hypothetical protein